MISGGLLALAHGTNDAQKTMGVITLALVANGNIAADDFHVPEWVVASAATAIALGTYVGGWRIIKTMGSRIHKMDSAQGFAAQGSGAAVILASSHVGFPLSTTQTISGAVIGSGAAKRLSAVRWGVAGNIVAAWIITLPASALIGGAHVWRRPVLRHRSGGTDRGVRADPRRGGGAPAAPRPATIADAAGARGMILATIVDTSELLEVVWTAALAGVGVTAAYGAALLGIDRAVEYGRDDRAARGGGLRRAGGGGQRGGGGVARVRHPRHGRQVAPYSPSALSRPSMSPWSFQAPTDART